MHPIIMALAALAALGSTAAPEAPAALPGWMAGAWQQEGAAGADGAWADEYWTPPRGGTMIGAARIGRGETLSIFEHSRIVRKADGTLSFFAQPRGAPAAEFPMTAQDATMIEFSNPAHDYPQRIRYWREGDHLKARISLIDGSRPVEWDYAPMRGD
ncbi:DUF6265 family protein [Sphingopyxis sp.]|uniref:DUF6265 family protein n=1 Tax=Sphingopyxis sp. TaxID=1908224 RepID=UPI0035B3E30B